MNRIFNAKLAEAWTQSNREIRNAGVLSEFSTFLKIIKSKEQIVFHGVLFLPYLRLTVKIFQFLRLRLTPLRPSEMGSWFKLKWEITWTGGYPT